MNRLTIGWKGLVDTTLEYTSAFATKRATHVVAFLD